MSLESGTAVIQSGRSAPSRQFSILQRILRNWLLYLLLVPPLALLGLFIYFPAVQALYESFFSWDPGLVNDFVGLRNYERVLTDPVWWIAWRNMLVIVVWRFSLPFVMPFIVAECIYNLRNRRMQAFYRTAVLIPTLVPGIVTLMLWRWMYQLDGGMNILLTTAGFGHLAASWLGQPHTALPALLFMGFPWTTGAGVLIYLAGLSNISADVIDAATIDGCSKWRRIFAIDLPNITGVIRLFLVFGIIDVFQEFGPMLAITRGGPFFATMTPGLFLYQRAFGIERFDLPAMGEASAVGVLLFALILVFSLLGHKYIKSSAEVEGIKV